MANTGSFARRFTSNCFCSTVVLDATVSGFRAIFGRLIAGDNREIVGEIEGTEGNNCFEAGGAESFADLMLRFDMRSASCILRLTIGFARTVDSLGIEDVFWVSVELATLDGIGGLDAFVFLNAFGFVLGCPWTESIRWINGWRDLTSCGFWMGTFASERTAASLVTFRRDGVLWSWRTGSFRGASNLSVLSVEVPCGRGLFDEVIPFDLFLEVVQYRPDLPTKPGLGVAGKEI